MQFRHILAEDFTYEDAVLLDKARAEGYDEITPARLGELVKERSIDVWRLEGGPAAIIATTFVEDLGGRALDVNYAYGAPGGLPELPQVIKALWQLADRLACYRITMTTTRPAWAKLLGAKEIARIYSVPRPGS